MRYPVQHPRTEATSFKWRWRSKTGGGCYLGESDGCLVVRNSTRNTIQWSLDVTIREVFSRDQKTMEGYFFFRRRFWIVFGFLVLCFPVSLIFCFSASLLFCFSAFLFLLLCFLLALLLCFLLFLLFAFLLLCFPCFSAFVLLRLSTSTILLFLFFSHVFLLLHFLLLCFFASCRYCLCVFHFILLYSVLFVS